MPWCIMTCPETHAGCCRGYVPMMFKVSKAHALMQSAWLPQMKEPQAVELAQPQPQPSPATSASAGTAATASNS